MSCIYAVDGFPLKRIPEKMAQLLARPLVLGVFQSVFFFTGVG